MWLGSIRRLLGFRPRSNGFRTESALRRWRGPHLDFERLEDRFAPAVGVFTNKLDYRPAETAVITATGFDIGSVVQFHVVHDPSTPGIPGGAGHEPWSVQDGSPQDLDGSANGTVVTTWYVNPDDSAHATFILTASGSSGGQLQTATTTFTDAPEKADLDHFANLVNGGEYTDGDLNSNKASYLEGDSVPYRIVFSSLVGTETYTITIGYDTTKGGAHAFDYFTTYNRTQASDPLAGVSGVTGPTDTQAIPVDPKVTAGPDGTPGNGDDLTQIPGVFTLFGGNITAVSAYTYSGTYAVESSAFISVTFTVNSGGDTAVLAWSGHIATRDDWGPNSSAGAISGSPYHQHLEDFTNTGGSAGTGSQDHQLQSDVVIIPATITIIKDTVPDAATDFSFSTTGGLTPSTFSLDDDGDNGNTLSNTQTFTGIFNFGTYTITEQAQTGFDVSIAVAGASSFSTSGSTATINLKEGESVTVTFTNTLRDPKLAIDKIVVGVFNADNTPDADGIAETAGDYIKYDVKVTNTGNVPLTGVIVSDPLLGGTLASGVTLGVGASQTFTGTYTVKQSDLDNRGGGDDDIDNTATADSAQTDPVSDSEDVPLLYDPKLAIDKIVVGVFNADNTPDSDGIADDAGDYIKYDVKVTNTGNITLTGVTVADPLLGGTLASNVTLAPGASQTFSGTYTVTQTDLNNRGGGDDDIDNTATADSNQTDPASDSESAPLAYTSGLAIDKIVVGVFNANNTPDGDGIADDAGDYIKYDVKVTNTGNVALTGVTVSDPLLGGTLASGVTLAVGASQTFSGTYTVKQSDLDNRGGGDDDIDNTATADSDQTGPVSDSESVPLGPLGSIRWEKRREDTSALQGGATFEIRDAVTDDLIKTIADNSADDADSTAGQLKATGIPLGTYKVIETVSPAGFARDDDFARLVTVSADELYPVIGTQGQNDAGNTDESDFHNRLGKISWEKRRDDTNELQGGATFEIRDAATNELIKTVTDNGAGDIDSDAGQITVKGIKLGTYNVIETNSPAGFALDDDPIRQVTVSDDTFGGELYVVIGTQGVIDHGNDDEADFFNRRGSIEWEKRREDTNELQGGATFTITNNATGVLFITVTDNGPGDEDPDEGQIKVINVPLGNYTVRETVAPAGFALDDDPTRLVKVSSGDLYAVIGTQGEIDTGNHDESDFFNRLGSIEWEKRREDTNALQGGATFTVTDNATGNILLTVTDNGPGDQDPDEGQIKVVNIPLSTYTVTETVAPAGWALDDDPTRVVTVSAGNLNPVIGTQTVVDLGNTDESDFINQSDSINRLGKIAWEKRRADTFALQGGATFEIRDAETGDLFKRVKDNGPGDANPLAGKITVKNVPLGTYTVTEVIPPFLFYLDDDPTRLVTVGDDRNGIDDDGDGIVDDPEKLFAVIGRLGVIDFGNSDESDFFNRPKDFSKKNFIL